MQKSTAALSVIAGEKAVPTQEPTTFERIAALNAQAKTLSDELVDETLAAMRVAAAKLEDLSKAGEHVKPGIRERARLMTETVFKEIEQIAALRVKA